MTLIFEFSDKLVFWFILNKIKMLKIIYNSWFNNFVLRDSLFSMDVCYCIEKICDNYFFIIKINTHIKLNINSNDTDVFRWQLWNFQIGDNNVSYNIFILQSDEITIISWVFNVY